MNIAKLLARNFGTFDLVSNKTTNFFNSCKVLKSYSNLIRMATNFPSSCKV